MGFPTFLPEIRLIQGHPGVARSHLSLILAASLSRGWPSPREMGPCLAERTLLVSTEDGLADTIRPRLEAASADLERIFALNQAFALDRAGLEAFELEIRRIDPALVVIDPLVAVIGGEKDIYRANEVRQIMAPLARLAEQRRFACVAVRHWRKHEGRALGRGTGSVDFMAAVRSSVCVAPDPSDPNTRVMAHLKSNLSAPGPSLTFVLDDGAFKWTGTTTLTADDLADANSRPGPKA